MLRTPGWIMSCRRGSDNLGREIKCTRRTRYPRRTNVAAHGIDVTGTGRVICAPLDLVRIAEACDQELLMRMPVVFVAIFRESEERSAMARVVRGRSRWLECPAGSIIAFSDPG